ncbi:usherin-like [Gigantopelta aegis]|uniref:usherin-like n=1 Tax=Gigantopelta aegis TaxID=1735272 RepID=UPI001B888F99|nr:usherin-like [Gigantopelta aegis]
MELLHGGHVFSNFLNGADHVKMCFDFFFSTVKMKIKICRGVHKFSLFSFLLFLSTFTPAMSASATSRKFPPLFNAAKGRNIWTEPSASTCGLPLRNAYCRSSTLSHSVDTCLQRFCVQTCTSRTRLPPAINLLDALSPGLPTCVNTDTVNVRPNSSVEQYSTVISSAGDKCYLLSTFSPNIGNSGAFSISVWCWIENTKPGILVQKTRADNGDLILELLASPQGLIFNYKSASSLSSVTLDEVLPLRQWIHLVLQVYNTSVSFFINGTGPGFSAARTFTLVSQVQDVSGHFRIGQNTGGTSQFIGKLQNFRFFSSALTNREVAQVYSGVFPEVRIQSDCRCPESHPRIKAQSSHYCIANGVPDNAGSDVLRFNKESHPLEYANDGDSNSIWVSKFVDRLNITIDLGDEFQVFLVILQFYGPQPKAVIVERQYQGSSTWETWQLYADDCKTYFNITNNGPLPTPSSYNCLQFRTQNVPYSKGNITFNLLAPEPVARPGHSDFYNTPELFQFVKATKIRLQFIDHFYVKNARHKYYGLYEYIISGRCNCHGHAKDCQRAVLPYVCACTPASHTRGRLCDECEPLFNNKPFRRGDQVKDYNCQPCECYGHADSCVYDPSLDPFPKDFDRGGGGKCVDCKHNTTGRFCDVCVDFLYRPEGRSYHALDVCLPCHCNDAGVKGNDMNCNKEGGQCSCKVLAAGRRCDSCRTGYYNLTSTNPVGCDSCLCHTPGTEGSNVSCDLKTGQCKCKKNVRGIRCKFCGYGFYHLDSTNPLGCTPCDCDPIGSTGMFCDPKTGECNCKDNVFSQKCNQCRDKFYNFSAGCLACPCSAAGTEPNTVCNKETGQCFCKANTEGINCDQCKNGSYSLGSSPEFGCEKCICDPRGTLSDVARCNKMTGSCLCKNQVRGRRCNQCKQDSWGLDANNPLGCKLCNCSLSGTVSSKGANEPSCNQNTGECACLSNRISRDCSDCEAGFYISLEGGCKPCDCHPEGTLPGTSCNSLTGQCECRGGNSGVTGRGCSECLPAYYNFDSRTGLCTPCQCNEAGSLNNTCSPITGMCFCKQFVIGKQCNMCVNGSSSLDANNPFGCSKAPAQQPPPTHIPLSSTSIALSWGPPDYPNGIIKQYNIVRNGTILTHLDNFMFNYNDTNLKPYTLYAYSVEAVNSFGTTRSTTVIFRTLAGKPSSDAMLSISDIRSHSALFSWTPPSNMHGPLEKFTLFSRTPSSPDADLVHWEGKQQRVNLTDLIPFTNYSFTVQTCTSGGCSLSNVVMLTTLSSVPEGQQAPVITPVGSTKLFIKWDHPKYPNGIIIIYELWMQGLPDSNGIRKPILKRIFFSSGQYNPRPVTNPQENALSPPITNFTVMGLEPFTQYEFQVLAQNDAGKAASPWTPGRTGEAAPLSAPPPTIVGISSTELMIKWQAPKPDESRGSITSYKLYQLKMRDALDTFAPPSSWKLIFENPSEVFSFSVSGLRPYSEHTFKIEACNSIGCINSTTASGRTLLAAPEGVRKPFVDGYNSSVMKIIWKPPLFANGPPPQYTVDKTLIALSYPPVVVRGTRFPGSGYYKFSSDVIPQNVAFTGVRFKFRMKKEDNLRMMFYTSSPNQDEFVAIQFQNGRPRWMFDTQSCLTVIDLNETMLMENNHSLTDGEYHFAEARRSGPTGRLIVDNQYEGTNSLRDKNCKDATIIGQTTGVYIGGLPANFKIRQRKERRAKITRTGFQGCISDIELLQQETPVEVWKKLDWNDAQSYDLAFLNWEGCPVNLDVGIHFMGKGFARLPFDNQRHLGGDQIDISLSFRTASHTGLLFFSHGGTGIYVYGALIKGVLRFEVSNRLKTESFIHDNPDVNFCDGMWHTVFFHKTGHQGNITVLDGGSPMIQGDPEESFDIPTVSDISVGGIDPKSEAATFIKTNNFSLPIEGFGGCINKFFVHGGDFAFLDEALAHANLNMDGCPPVHSLNKPCEEKLVVKVYEGTNTTTYDVGLQPYTDYIYRVTASNDAGSVSGPWGYGRTREGAPVGVQPPDMVRALTGYMFTANWPKPDSTSGLLTKYILTAYNVDNPEIDPIVEEYTDADTTSSNVTGTIPYTNYLLKISACTSGGCTESEKGTPLLTLEEAPENVPPPTAKAGPTFLEVSWKDPAKPNGKITGYYLFWNSKQVYAGGLRTFNITNLRVYTAYQLFVKTCTQAGCAESPSVALSTAQLQPSSVDKPNVQALGSKRVEVRWTEPDHLNGVLERYILYLSRAENMTGSVVYNNSDFFLSYIITKLTAGTTYYIRLAACTGGGCMTSDPSNVTTDEGAPEGVPDPIITSPSPSELMVVWGEPTAPNGMVVRYDLYQNGIIVSNSLVRQYRVDSLEPYSLHIFRVAACTIQGCGFSNQVEAHTMEFPPRGIVVLSVTVKTPRSVNASWTAPDKPNGKLYYDVYFDGIFYKNPDQWDYTTVRERRSLYHDIVVYQMVTIGGLVPFSQYSVQVNASNTKGFILGSMQTIRMPPGTPDGVRPPSLVSETSSSIKATWLPVGRINSNEEVSYYLQFREKKEDAVIQDVFGPTTTFSYVKENLLPFTVYEFRLQAKTSEGTTSSDWVSQVTRQDKPTGFDPPTITAVQARYISLDWSPPVNPNGIIKEYNIFQNGDRRTTVPGNITVFQADGLTPFTFYSFIVEVCTLAGCTISGESSRVRTLEAAPDGIAAPVLKSPTPASVEVRWSKPANPNGLLTGYSLERKITNTDNVELVASFPATAELAYIDESAALSPFTKYDYRIRVTNTAGTGAGAWGSVTTMSSRPAGVLPPNVNILGPTSMRVSWKPPIQPNGVLESYIIRLPEPQIEIRNTTTLTVDVTNLIPFTKYAVTVTACTSGGCTESVPFQVRTDASIPVGQDPPTPTAISQSMISVLWQRPKQPGGPSVSFELSRQKVRQPLDGSVSDLLEWQSVYSGTAFFYEDRGLPMFTTYIYRVTVFNQIGQITSQPSKEVTTFGGLPRRPPNITVSTVSHLTLRVEWTLPPPVELQGEVQNLTVDARSKGQVISKEADPSSTSLELHDLVPNVNYTIKLTVTIFGGASITSKPVVGRTSDGAPVGLAPPILTVISDTSLRVAWTAPQNPNGEIQNYTVYVDKEQIPTNQTTPGSMILTGLEPYTVYNIYVEACTVFACTKSKVAPGTTSEAVPRGVFPPTLSPVNSTTILVQWKLPEHPNGIIMRYDIRRMNLKDCNNESNTSPSPEQLKCTYIECGPLQGLCGTTCFSGARICCDDVIHDIKAGFACCGSRYDLKPSDDAVCCGGKFFSPIRNYQCCGTRYVEVRSGEICCPDSVEDRISIGYGDTCCEVIPFSSLGSQLCCAGKLSMRFGQQCCGRQVVKDTAVCCGGGSVGEAYIQQIGRVCCGSQYVDNKTSLCCVSDTGHTKVHYYSSETDRSSANEQCCGLEKVSQGLSCCNYVGYNSDTQVCADRSVTMSGCGSGVVCQKHQAASAFCNRCDFNTSAHSCTAVTGYIEKTSPTSPPTTCFSDVKTVYSGLEMSYTDSSLSPHSRYKYSVSVVNSAGVMTSDFIEVTSLQAAPQDVRPPVTRVQPDMLYKIYLTWDPPGKPNGEITQYVLKRDTIELYRGLKTEFTDDSAIVPYRTYSYILTACTSVGCTDSNVVSVATAQAPPEQVVSPTVNVITSSMLQIKWRPPGKPNGVIIMYRIIFLDIDNFYNKTEDERMLIVTNVTPYTKYRVLLEACTSAGCTRSDTVTVTTLEDVPQGLQTPRIVVLNSSSIQLYWKEPATPNGIIVYYQATRHETIGGTIIYNGLGLTAVDTGLSPGTTYQYSILAATGAGNTTSGSVVVTMPQQTPIDIPPPVVKVLSATDISVSWQPVTVPVAAVDQYKVLLNVGLETEVEEAVGLLTAVSVSNLLPFTDYEVRLQVCIKDIVNGCGTSAAVKVKTQEAPPENQDPPDVVAKASNAVDISWKPPRKPNGVIKMYRIYQRAYNQGIELIINQVDGSILHFTHAGKDVKPFTLYEYRIRALNSKGQTNSDWSRVRTLEAVPEDIGEPVVNATGSVGVSITWKPPRRPNGRINLYKVHYRAVSVDPTTQNSIQSVYVNGNVTATSISGLLPNWQYEILLEAENSVGSVNSSWVRITTNEASPAGLGKFQVEKITSGYAVVLRWDVPALPNGVITTYRIYEAGSEVPIYQGLNRVFEFRRLFPYTEYTVQLEACTNAGCTLGVGHKFTTAEIPPTSQPSPSIANVKASEVALSWSKPANPNGKILSYEILRRTNIKRRKRDLSQPVVIYKTNNTDAEQNSYVDNTVEPHKEYHYRVRTTNSKGTTDSPWQVVFTNQAAPQGVEAPVVSYIPENPNTLKVTWTAPTKPNGIIQSYQIQRNGSASLSFLPDVAFEYNDTGLEAFTWYSYTLTVCSGGGCTTSLPTLIQTNEAAPLQVLAPVVTSVSSTAIRAKWTKPRITNGEISLYQLKMDGVVVYEGLVMEFIVGKLTPYREYTFTLKACTSGGCSESGEVVGRPFDAPPTDMAPPILRVMSSTSIEISWDLPVNPNGVITSYDVRRDGRLIYTNSLSSSGRLSQTYTDYSLEPGEEYSYTVLARNRKGSIESPSSKAQTYSSSPSGMDPPSLLPATSTSILVTWKPPIQPNGDIIRYNLYRGNDKVYTGKPDQLSYTVPGLQYFTEYTFRVEACTVRGCGLSEPASVKTLEARPEEQRPPTLLPLGNENGAHNGVLVSWDPPLKPNGQITKYEIRRQLIIVKQAGTIYGDTILAYNGTEFKFTDQDSRVEPFQSYRYMVTAHNSVGKADSTWTVVKTKEAAPTAVSSPLVDSVTATTITVNITAPLEPNGVIRHYNILVNRSVATSDTALHQIVGILQPLKPFTVYLLQVRACTGGGCTDSRSSTVITGMAKPTGLAPLVVTDVTNNSTALSWKYPVNSNGIIKRFWVYQRRACPPTAQPFEESCVPSDPVKVYEGLELTTSVSDLSPYVAYEFQLQTENNAGVVDFPTWVRAETTAAVPVYTAFPRLSKDGTKAVIDWTKSFLLNGRLREYILVADGKVVFRGITTSHGVERETKTQVINFVVQLITYSGEAETPVVTFDPQASGNIGTTPTPVGTTDKQTGEKQFYEEVWFIILLCLVGLLIIFCLAAFCLWRIGGRQPYIRERAPLQTHVKPPGSKQFYVIDASDGSVIDTELMHERHMPTYNGPGMGVINPAFINGTTPREFSLDKYSEKFDDMEEEEDDEFWEKNFDSGLYDDDLDSLSEPAYSYTREQTVFTDTHL